MAWTALQLSAEQRWAHIALRLKQKNYRLQVEATCVPSGNYAGIYGMEMELIVQYRVLSLSANGLHVDAGYAVSANRSWEYEVALVERLERTLDRLWAMGDGCCGR